MTVLALALAATLVAVVVSGAISRRTFRQRIDAANERLGETAFADRGGLETSLARLERAVEIVGRRIDVARSDVARTAQALEAIPQGVVVCDQNAIEVFRNEVAQAFSGARHAEVIVERAVHEVLAAALGGSHQRRELDLLGPPRRMLVISAAPLHDGVRSTGALAVIDDVSERRRLEAVRRDFVANISHELKTPVGALGVLAETIGAEEDLAVIRRLAERMTGEAIRVGRIIDDLLTLSRIEGEAHPVREPVAVRDVVGDAVERVRSMADAHGVTISTDGVSPAHAVRGDRRQLGSAVGNLLENACKYSDDGSAVEIASSAGEGWVEITVRDQGIGIPTTDLERVFERFYRVDRARSRDTGGTGLGLAIVRHVAGNHHGDVRVESSEGEGSTFTLRLPTRPDTLEEEQPA